MKFSGSFFTPFWLLGFCLAVGAAVYVLGAPHEIVLVTVVIAGLLGALDWMFNSDV